MSLGVLNNLSAVYAENYLNNTNNSLNTVLQQLSSGSKINSGADDAAGLSLVNGLQANQQALNQSSTNATEGVGLLQVADGALSQVTSLLNRAVTLATEASNGTLNSTQDLAANSEYQSILSEINNIGATTTYNQEAVFNSTTSIYTGDSSTTGSSVDSLNIRSLSSTNLGDSNGQMSYSNGQSNVFIDLSTAGQNAAVTDSLGASSATTTVKVGYVTTGGNGAAVQATANISVGAGTSYANTAQGLIDAINGAGLGLSASFGTATQAGTGATTSALDGGYTNTAALTNGNDTGIIISGKNIGVNTESTGATGVYTNGAGGVGTLTVSQVNDTLSGTLNVTDSNGTLHALTLGAANSTDTLSNLMNTINSEGWGVTASLNSSSVTNASGTHAADTILSLTSASSQVAVTGTNIVDSKATTTAVTPTLTGGGTGAGAGTTMMSFSVNASTDTLSGVLTLTGDASTPASTNLLLGTSGSTDTLTNLAATINAANAAGQAYSNITATVSNSGKTITFTETGAKVTNYPSVVVATGSEIQDQAATTGTAVVSQATALTATSAANSTFGTVTVSNANDTLSGTLHLSDVANTAGTAITLGTAGSTDTLTNLASYINNTLDGGSGTSKITAVLSNNGTTLSLENTTVAAGSANDMVYGSNIGTTLSLTGTPTAAGTANATTLGQLALPVGGSAGDTLAGTLAIGSNTITLGTATGTNLTNTMANLAATINNGNYGVTATLNSTQTAITFTTANSDIPANITVTNSGTDSTDAGKALGYTTWNQGVTSSQYYSMGISGTVADSSTGGGTADNGLAFSSNGKGTGVATISYADSAGANLSATSLSSQSSAQSALTALNTAIADVSAQDGYIGSQINTLNSVSQVLSTQSTNVQSAQNAVQATDYAQATSDMSKYEILSQTGIAALAQANSNQQNVLKLLQ